jgi:hypothetical protein
MLQQRPRPIGSSPRERGTLAQLVPKVSNYLHFVSDALIIEYQ